MQGYYGATKTRVALFAVIVFSIIGCTFSWYASNYFAHWSDTVEISEQVVIGNRTYHVEGRTVASNGAEVSHWERTKAIQIAYAATLARRSPLLALPSVDLVELASAVDRLTQTQIAVAGTVSGEDRTLVETSLFPIAFLRMTVETEGARRAFLTAPSVDRKETYEALQQALIETYEEDLSQYAQALDAIAGKEDLNYAIMNGTITSESLSAALQGLAVEISATKSRLKKRAWCMKGILFYCDSAALTLQSVSVPAVAVLGVSELERDVMSLRAEVLGRQIETGKNPGHIDALVRIERSACLSGERIESPLFLVLDAGTSSERRRAQAEYVGDIFFFRAQATTSIAAQRSDVPQFFAAHNVNLIRITPESYYQCLDVALDVSRVETTLRTAAFARMHPDLAPDEARSITEESFAYTEHAARAYLHRALQTARERGARKEVHALEELALAWSYHSSGFEILVGRISSLINQYVDMGKANIRYGISPFFLFTVNSGFYTLFQAHNPSFIRAAPPVYAIRLNDVPPNNVVFYSDIRGTMPRVDIVRALKFFSQFHTAPSTIEGITETTR